MGAATGERADCSGWRVVRSKIDLTEFVEGENEQMLDAAAKKGGSAM